MAEYLELNGTSMDQAGKWFIPDLAPLRTTAERRGSDRILPNVAGVKTYVRRATVTQIVLPTIVIGDDWGELDDNVDELQDALDLTESTLDTVVAIWHRYDGSTRTADVHVIGLFDPRLIGPQPPTMQFALTISHPNGLWTPLSGS